MSRAINRKFTTAAQARHFAYPDEDLRAAFKARFHHHAERP
jgi:hypothetical protein